MDDDQPKRKRRPRCTARNRRGKRCGRFPAPGARVCSMHGGRAPQVAAAARARAVEAEAVRQLAAEGYAPAVDAVAELLSLAAEVTALKDVLRGRVADLSDPALVAVYERALDRVERVLTGMLHLDLEARRVSLAERDAAMVWEAIEAGLAAIGASDRSELFREAFAEQLGRSDS